MKAKWVLSLFVLALVSSSFAVVIGDFENGSYDGWVAQTAVLSLGLTGHTLGNDALQLVVGDGWFNAASVSVIDKIPNLTQAGSKITMDVSNMNSDGSIVNWWFGIFCVINTDGNWIQLGGEQQRPVTWDLSTNKLEFVLTDAARTALALPDRTYAEIFVGSNSDGAKFYLDNVQIVPEPTTMVLLGLGGLSLIRRKR